MKIVIASNNVKKVQELQRILATENVDTILQSEYNAPEVEETGLTFVENAILKARSACKYAGMPAVADDSGLEVDALAGCPGIYSARYAGEGSLDKDNVTKLLEELTDVPKDKRLARFRCVIVFMRFAADPSPIICQGTWEGEILFNPQGEKGFGYDPVFWVPEYDCSAAELSSEIKNRISHRAQALQKLTAVLRKGV